MVTTNITVRDTARMTGHPIADFLALFSILVSSPLIASFGSPDYYNCQKAILSRKRDFQYSYTFSICVIVPYVLNLQQSFYNILFHAISISHTMHPKIPHMSFQIAKVKGIPVRLHFTLIIVFFLIAWTLSSSFMPRYFLNLTTVQY